MDIRVNKSDKKRLQKIWDKTPLDKENCKFNEDQNAVVPVIIAPVDEGEFIVFLTGYKKVKEFIKHGYNRITGQCPFRHRTCIGIKCSLYLVRNFTGDCSIRWTAINTRSK